MSLLPWCVASLFVDSLRFQAAVRALKQMQRWITERSCLVHGSTTAIQWEGICWLKHSFLGFGNRWRWEEMLKSAYFRTAGLWRW